MTSIMHILAWSHAAAIGLAVVAGLAAAALCWWTAGKLLDWAEVQFPQPDTGDDCRQIDIIKRENVLPFRRDC